MPLGNDYDHIFAAAAREFDVDPLMLKAMASQESAGNLKAVSKAGAQGLMQIMSETQRALGVTNPSDPWQNIFGGAKYLSQAIDAEKGDPAGALLYYHGGPRWRSSYGSESQGYVPAVAGHYQQLARLASQPFVAGDSIGYGIQQAGKYDGIAQEKLSPQQILDRIGSLKASVLNRPIILSSGVSNDPSQIKKVTDQIQELQRRGASAITLLGVGDRSDFTGLNDQLAGVAQATGAQFAGPIPPDILSGDHVHPKTYGPLLSAITGQPPPTQTAQQDDGGQ